MNVDNRTCRERQDEAIAELQEAIKARLFIDKEVVDEINDLRARVAALEARLADMTATVTIPTIGSLDARTNVAALHADWVRCMTADGWRKEYRYD